MKKTIYLHIGTHKTGTTAVQKFSTLFFKELIELGFYYPLVSRPNVNNISIGHHLLPWYLLKHSVPKHFYGKYQEKPDKLIKALVDDIKSSHCTKAILSSEEFDRLNGEQVEKLHEHLMDFNVKIILYLRRKDSFFEAMYQTDVVSDNQSTLIQEYINTMSIPENYYVFVQKWRNVFGEENVDVNFYCKKSLKSNDIVIDFYDRLGLNVAHLINNDEKKMVNESIPFQYVGVITMLRRMNAPDDIINSLKRIAYKIGDNASKEYHFLSLEERMKFGASGLAEIKQLGLTLPDEECFSLSEEEKKKNVKQENFSALKQVFADFEKFMNKNR